jgi:ATP-dependent RNA helicase DHX8/PRP22
VSYPVKIIHNEEPVSDYIIEAYTIIKGIVLDDKKRKEKLKGNYKKDHKNIDDEVNEFLEIDKENDGYGEGCNNENEGCDIISNINPIDINKDILVFLTGEEDINELYKLLKRILNIQVFKIYSSLSDSEQSKIFEDSPLRKVILSTNICETSLTIPGIKYVIDCGLAKTKIFDKIEYMGILAISKESVEQRTGRCNRTGPGICYRLYPKMKMLPLIPEIKRTDLSNCILQLTNFGINIFDCEFLDYPPQSNVFYAIQFLLKKKLIYLKIKNGNKKYKIEDNCVYIKKKGKGYLKVDVDNKKKLNDASVYSLLDNIFNLNMKIFITNYGKIINSLPFDTNLSCFYQDCLSNNVSYYGSILTAMISLNNYNFIKNPINDTGKNSGSGSDLEFLINLFEDYLISENKFNFCKEKGISQKFLEKACNIFHKLNKKKDKNDILILEKVFSDSFSYNKSIKEKDGSYIHLESKRKVFIHPTSCYFKKSEKQIVFVDVLCTTKEYIRIVGKYYP